MKFTNRVRIYGVDEHGNAREQIGFNTLTYAAADVLIRAMLQSGPARVTHLYAQHGGSTNTAPITLPGDPSATRNNFVATANTYDNGGLWVPLLAAPAVSASDPTTYAGNLCTFYFRIPGNVPSTQYTGNYVAGTSKIYGIGLAVAVNANDRTQDQIISAYNSFTPFPIASNAQESVDYPFQITI